MDLLPLLGTVAIMWVAVCVAYYVSCRVRPLRPCGRCAGSGVNWRRATDCRRCEGSGRRDRFGTWLFFREH